MYTYILSLSLCIYTYIHSYTHTPSIEHIAHRRRSLFTRIPSTSHVYVSFMSLLSNVHINTIYTVSLIIWKKQYIYTQKYCFSYEPDTYGKRPIQMKTDLWNKHIHTTHKYYVSQVQHVAHPRSVFHKCHFIWIGLSSFVWVSFHMCRSLLHISFRIRIHTLSYAHLVERKRMYVYTKRGMWKRPTHMKRDSYEWKETYPCEKRPVCTHTSSKAAHRPSTQSVSYVSFHLYWSLFTRTGLFDRSLFVWTHTYSLPHTHHRKQHLDYRRCLFHRLFFICIEKLFSYV